MHRRITPKGLRGRIEEKLEHVVDVVVVGALTSFWAPYIMAMRASSLGFEETFCMSAMSVFKGLTMSSRRFLCHHAAEDEEVDASSRDKVFDSSTGSPRRRRTAIFTSSRNSS